MKEAQKSAHVVISDFTMILFSGSVKCRLTLVLSGDPTGLHEIRSRLNGPAPTENLRTYAQNPLPCIRSGSL